MLLAAMAAVADLYRPANPRAAVHSSVFESAAWEIGAGLRFTRRAAEGWLALAEDVVRRLPGVHQPLLAGAIDVARARGVQHRAGHC